MNGKRFQDERLDAETKASLEEKILQAKGDILRMTTIAGCGHPGGSMSSLEFYTTLLALANVFPDDPRRVDRDRVVVSHGHTSPGMYSALGVNGFVDREEAVAGFRLAGSRFEGHVERTVPGVEWNTGNLGQGLSAACGFALASRINGVDYNVFCLMGDGEQQKGQISEARRFAAKFKLSNLTAIVDLNGLQISGETSKVMPHDVAAEFRAEGWKVIEVEGHDLDAVYGALRQATCETDAPTAIIARTVMGKGVSFMENKEKWHGQSLPDDLFAQAMEELGLDADLDPYRKRRAEMKPEEAGQPAPPQPKISTGTPRTYGADEKTDNRSAWGQALEDLAEANQGGDASPIAVMDCDLAGSVKTGGFEKKYPDRFIQGGIQEHNAAVVAGALSMEGILTFFADFGVFSVDETYNQHRLNDINETNLKLVATHVGLDVGEDGKTHQCIDYVGALRNFFGFKPIIPADPNQTDRAVRYAAGRLGNFFVGMGRSKMNMVLNEAGEPAFGGDYAFEYGKADVLRKGPDATLIAMGCMTGNAVKAADILKEKGIGATVLCMSCPLAVDREALREAAKTGLIVTVEDHNVNSGLGLSVANALAEEKLAVDLIKLGVDRYMCSGTSADLFKLAGIDAKSIAAKIEAAVAARGVKAGA